MPGRSHESVWKEVFILTTYGVYVNAQVSINASPTSSTNLLTTDVAHQDILLNLDPPQGLSPLINTSPFV